MRRFFGSVVGVIEDDNRFDVLVFAIGFFLLDVVVFFVFDVLLLEGVVAIKIPLLYNTIISNLGLDYKQVNEKRHIAVPKRLEYVIASCLLR